MLTPIDIPGCVGTLIDETPMLTTAHVRPYIIALLLHRCAVKYHEIIATISPHCRQEDLIVGAWDPMTQDYCEGTRLESLVDEVLGEMTGDQLLRYNDEKDMWVLQVKHMSQIINWVSATGGQLPKHLLMEMSAEQMYRLPNYVTKESLN